MFRKWTSSFLCETFALDVTFHIDLGRPCTTEEYISFLSADRRQFQFVKMKSVSRFIRRFQRNADSTNERGPPLSYVTTHEDYSDDVSSFGEGSNEFFARFRATLRQKEKRASRRLKEGSVIILSERRIGKNACDGSLNELKQSTQTQQTAGSASTILAA